MDRELEQLKALAVCDSLEAYAVRLPAVSFGRLPAKKDESVSPIKRELAKAVGAVRRLAEFLDPLQLLHASGQEAAQMLPEPECIGAGAHLLHRSRAIVLFPLLKPPGGPGESVSPIKRELAKAMRASVKDSIRDMEERYFATPLELAARQGAACAGPVGTLIDLVLEFDKRMQEKKQDRKVIDFSDMEHFALGILLEGEGEEARPSAVALEYPS